MKSPIIQLLRRGAFRGVTHAISVILVSGLILLWVVTWPMFELSDWVAREGTESREKTLKAKLTRKEIGLGPRVVGAILIFISSVRQTRQFDRISRIRRSRGDFDDLAGDASVTGEQMPPNQPGEPHEMLKPMIEKMAAGQGGLI